MIRLIWSTPNPEFVCALAMRRCYSALPIEKLEADLIEKGPTYIKYLMDKVRQDKSFDIWEHACFMFELEGVSRALTHQLVRHRIMSVDQESQRFAPSPKEYIIPPSMENVPEAKAVFLQSMNESWQRYIKLIELKIPKQDARYVLPNAAETKLVITLNARSLMHLLHMRTAKGAQWEIRDLTNKIYEIVKPLCPNIFSQIVEC